MATAASRLNDVLSKTPITNILSRKDNDKSALVTLEDEDLLSTAIEVLSANQIQAAPVRSRETGDYLGWFSQYDIVTYVLRLFSASPAGGEVQWSSYIADFKTMEHKGEKFGKTPIKKIMAHNARNSFKVVESTLPLSDVLVEFFSKGTTRLAVSFNNMLVDVVTPTDIIVFLASLDLGDIGSKTLRELGLPSNAVTKISWDSPAIHAFYLMYYLNVSSVAVVDGQGRLVTTISASDIKRIGTTDLSQLLQPLRSYSAKHAPAFLPPVTSEWTTPVSAVISQLALFRIHQSFITETDHTVSGVITIHELCTWVCRMLGK